MFFSKIFFNFLNSGLIKNIYIFNTYMMITMISLVNWLGAFICFLSCFSCKHICTKKICLCVGSPKTIQNGYYHSNKSNTEDATCRATSIKENKYTRKMPTCLHQFTLVNARSMVCAMDPKWFMHWWWHQISTYLLPENTWQGRLCRERRGRRRPSTQHPCDSPGPPRRESHAALALALV